MLFKLIYGKDGPKDFFELNPGAKAIPEFAERTSQQMWFVCLVADHDHDSPLRTLPEDRRRYHAALTAGYQMEATRPDKNTRNLLAGKVATVEKAIAKHREIQYDEDKESLEAITRQIQEARALMAMDKIAAVTYKDEEGNDHTDTAAAIKLAADAAKLGTNLDKLLAAKDNILARIKQREPTTQVPTLISAGLQDDGSNRSTLDRIMAAKRTNTDE